MATTMNIILAAETAGAVKDLNRAKAATDGVARSVNKASNAAKRMDGQFNKTGVAMNKFGKGVAQQAGFQIADFAVQVGNGTSAIQAFGQQGSQMLAIFGPIGSLLGAGVAVFSALAVVAEKSGKSFFGFAQETRTAKEATDELNDALSNLSKTYLTDVEESVAKAKKVFGELTPELTVLLDVTRRIAQEKVFAAISKDVEDFAASDSIKQAEKAFKAFQATTEEGLAPTVFEQFSQSLAIQNKRLKDLKSNAEAVSQRFPELNKLIEDMRGKTSFSSEELRKYAEKLGELSDAIGGDVGDRIGLFGESLLNTSVKLSEAAEGLEGTKDAVEKVRQSFDEATKSLEEQNDELRVRNELFGEAESVVTRKIKLVQLGNELEGISNKLLEGQAERRIAAIEQQFKQNQLAEQLKEAEKAREEAAKEADKRRREELEWTISMEKKRAKALELNNKKMMEDQKRINDLMRDGFKSVSDAITGLINKTNSWQSVLSTVLKKVIDIASKMGTTKSGGFSFGKLFGSLGSIFAGSVMPGTPMGTSTGPMFPGLMDFHTGGIVGGKPQKGMRSDERMIVARTGERVLNRGQAMMAEQGGTGGGVVVNQTINISTGVQQTVRAEIMSMAPQIAAQAKSAVLDAKRRGGGFAAAFS